jgi:hypothetical protein
MNKFKAGDKVKVVSAERDTYWYASKIGNIYTLKSLDGEDWVVRETRFGVLAACDLELVENEKETISKFLKENKWFIRTGSPEKSKLVQQWLFEHGCEWLFGKNVQSGFNEELLTNTNCMGVHEKYILFSTTYEKTNAQEITLEFETVVKSVKLPESAPKKTEAQLKLEELQRTIEDAQRQVAELKEEIK